MSNKMRAVAAGMALLCSPYFVYAGDVIYRYRFVPNRPPEAIVSGLVNMTDLQNKQGDGCEQFIGLVKVEGIQFSSSGGSIESFRFTDHFGNQWSVPTNIGDLSNATRSQANNFIRVGKPYYVQVQICGSGGFASLVNMYDASVKFGHD
ncbi:hypothetical protein WS98_21935 [Burkholderia territorii]|uniref:hypothetical protein n=1 Tax=Burkholderia territorii TaxID=1503055 RepID=UPI0007524C70|nr:hypothetical protein [Burkholderia territorii]KVL32200.1 hypothetical protein WS98_21935 [Burkholderia territorii]